MSSRKSTYFLILLLFLLIAGGFVVGVKLYYSQPKAANIVPTPPPSSGTISYSPRPDKSIIWMGWAYPSIDSLKDRFGVMDTKGFNGIVLQNLYQRPQYLANTAFTEKQLQLSDFEKDIRDIKAAKFTKVTNNFLRINTAAKGPNISAFEPEGGTLWPTIEHNLEVAGSVAKQTGMGGIFLDTEDYDANMLFTYDSKLPLYTGKSFEESKTAVRERGRQVMRAINKNYPDVTVMIPHSNTYLYYQHRLQGFQTPLERVTWNLFPSFLDGILETATPETVLIDAHESSYSNKTRAQFIESRNNVKVEAKKYSTIPEVYEKRIKVGFGLWLDNSQKWDLEDFSKNVFTPEEFGKALTEALRVSDTGVWIYSQAPNVWNGTKMPEAYAEAIRQARTTSLSSDTEPVLAELSNQSIEPNQKFTFTVPTASDPDQDGIRTWVEDLPEGSTYTPSTNTISWVPTTQNVGTHAITVKVSDGLKTTSQTLSLAVANPVSSQTDPTNSPEPSPTPIVVAINPSPSATPVISADPTPPMEDKESTPSPTVTPLVEELPKAGSLHIAFLLLVVSLFSTLAYFLLTLPKKNR